MWKLEVEGSSVDIYKELKTAFDKEVVEKEEFEFTVQGRSGSQKFTKERAVIDDETSLQFRRILKFVQGLTDEMTGDLKVTCSGEAGKSISVKVEEV